MTTRAVLVDLDDTLFDHRGSARAALTEVHRRHAAHVAFADFEQQHMHHLEVLHLEVLAGTRSIDDARRERFRRVFGGVGVVLDELGIDTVAIGYRQAYMGARRALDGAAALLEAIRPHARIAIVSNNLLDEQQEKLKFCGLAPLVDVLVVSEEAGVPKPDPAIFAIALERLDVPRESAVMFGDSWPADIVGAARAGIRPVWFNPLRKPRPPDPADVAEVFSLTPAEAVLPVLLGAADRVER